MRACVLIETATALHDPKCRGLFLLPPYTLCGIDCELGIAGDHGLGCTCAMFQGVDVFRGNQPSSWSGWMCKWCTHSYLKEEIQ